MKFPKRIFVFLSRVSMMAVVLAAVSPAARAADMKPDDVVARHLDSIGTAEARAGSKSRVVQGVSAFKMQVGAGGELQGTCALVSEGRKSVLMIKLANNDYHGEQFVTDGDKVSVVATTSNHKWSDFGDFVRSQDQLVHEGLLGGELTTAWALLHLADNKAKLNYDGQKQVDGRPAYQLTYHSKKRDDLTIHLYFDADTYRHVLTTYSITLASGLGGFSPSISDQAGLTTSSNPGGADITQSSKQNETRYTVEEKFSDFKTTEGLTLPTRYAIHFTEELQNGKTRVYEWDLAVNEIVNNQGLDPRNFQIK